MQPDGGFEPPTFALQVQRSTAELIGQYVWRWRVSISLPLACKASDLPIDLHPRMNNYYC